MRWSAEFTADRTASSVRSNRGLSSRECQRGDPWALRTSCRGGRQTRSCVLAEPNRAERTKSGRIGSVTTTATHRPGVLQRTSTRSGKYPRQYVRLPALSFRAFATCGAAHSLRGKSLSASIDARINWADGKRALLARGTGHFPERGEAVLMMEPPKRHATSLTGVHTGSRFAPKRIFVRFSGFV